MVEQPRRVSAVRKVATATVVARRDCRLCTSHEFFTPVCSPVRFAATEVKTVCTPQTQQTKGVRSNFRKKRQIFLEFWPQISYKVSRTMATAASFTAAKFFLKHSVHRAPRRAKNQLEFEKQGRRSEPSGGGSRLRDIRWWRQPSRLTCGTVDPGKP